MIYYIFLIKLNIFIANIKFNKMSDSESDVDEIVRFPVYDKEISKWDREKSTIWQGTEYKKETQILRELHSLMKPQLPEPERTYRRILISRANNLIVEKLGPEYKVQYMFSGIRECNEFNYYYDLPNNDFKEDHGWPYIIFNVEDDDSGEMYAVKIPNPIDPFSWSKMEKYIMDEIIIPTKTTLSFFL